MAHRQQLMDGNRNTVPQWLSLVSNMASHAHVYFGMGPDRWCPVCTAMTSQLQEPSLTSTGSRQRSRPAKYELRKGGRIGPGKDDDNEGRVLNRVVRWTEDGVEYQADPRQAEKLIESIGLSGEGVRSAVTPGFKCLKEQVDAAKELEQHDHTLYRGNGARCNYLGPTDPAFSTQPKRYAVGCIPDQSRPGCFEEAVPILGRQEADGFQVSMAEGFDIGRLQ